MDSSLEMIRAEVVGAAPPPPGVVPNFVDPASIGHHIIPYLATGLALSTSFLLMRIYTKISIVGLFGLDDGIACSRKSGWSLLTVMTSVHHHVLGAQTTETL